MSGDDALRIIGPELRRADDCEAILRSLPMWFGIEEGVRQYVTDSMTLPTFGCERAGRLMAFVTLREHFAEAWELHCIAVTADARGRGLGSALLAHAEAWLAARGAVYLQVKTVAASHPSAEYIETRAFYAARGYTSLEVFSDLWHPGMPVLQCVKRLVA